MKNVKSLIIMFVMSIIMSCSICFAECVFPDNQTEIAPAWICSDFYGRRIDVENFPYTATGQAKRSGIGAFHDKELAIFSARNNLTRRIHTDVVTKMSEHFERTGVDQTTVDYFFKATSRQFSHAVLSNSPVLATTISSKGDVYVLVGLEKANSERVVQKVIDTIVSGYNNEKAQYQKDVGEKNLKELDTEIKEFQKKPEIISGGYYKEKPDAKYFSDPDTKEFVKIVEVEKKPKTKEVKE